MAICSPCSAITRSHHSGDSSAAVPMFTRAHPVPSARSRLASSRMPPDSSTCTPGGADRGDDRREDVGVAPPPEGGVEVDQVDPLRALVDPAPGGGHRVAEHLLGPGDTLHELDGLAARHVDGGQQDEVVGLGTIGTREHRTTLPARPPPAVRSAPAPSALPRRHHQARGALLARSPGP